MIYIFNHFLTLAFASVIQKLRLRASANLFLFSCLIISLSYLPAMQYGVGTDYHSYVNAVESSVSYQLYSKKGEYIFYYIIVLIKSFDLNAQAFFAISTLLTYVSYGNAFRLLKRNNFNIPLVLFLFLVITNNYHSQMNVVRVMLAASLAVCFTCYMFEKKYIKAILFAVLMIFSHQSSIIVFPLIILIRFVGLKMFSIRKFLYAILFFVFLTGIPIKIVEFLVSHFLPYYSHYLDGTYINKSVSVTNLLTKAIHFPIGLIFLYLYSKRDYFFSNFEKYIVVIWVCTSSVYILLYYFYPTTRILYLFNFFAIVPYYYVVQYFLLCKNKLAAFICLIYAAVPYLIKVLLFPISEFTYSSFAF